MYFAKSKHPKHTDQRSEYSIIKIININNMEGKQKRNNDDDCC